MGGRPSGAPAGGYGVRAPFGDHPGRTPRAYEDDQLGGTPSGRVNGVNGVVRGMNGTGPHQPDDRMVGHEERLGRPGGRPVPGAVPDDPYGVAGRPAGPAARTVYPAPAVPAGPATPLAARTRSLPATSPAAASPARTTTRRSPAGVPRATATTRAPAGRVQRRR